MNALAEFKDYYKHLDEMIAESTKADPPTCRSSFLVYDALIMAAGIDE